LYFQISFKQTKLNIQNEIPFFDFLHPNAAYAILAIFIIQARIQSVGEGGSNPLLVWQLYSF
jgi:hypothetical protein